jgi:hypothetical protein
MVVPGWTFYTDVWRWGVDQWRAPRGSKEWGWGLTVHPSGAVGRQWLGRGGSRWAAQAHAAGPE